MSLIIIIAKMPFSLIQYAPIGLQRSHIQVISSQG